jgi:hypothetical protein
MCDKFYPKTSYFVKSKRNIEVGGIETGRVCKMHVVYGIIDEEYRVP